MSTQSYTNAPHPTTNLVDTMVCDRYLLVETLGAGAFATVYRGVDTHCKHRTEYAIKCMVQGARGSSRQRRQVREVTVHRKVSSHHNIATIHNAVLQEMDNGEGLLFIVMELCEKGDLCDAIVKRGMFFGNDELVKNVFLQIIDALTKCHSKGVYHMDLKPENILISSEDSTSCQIRLADFGLATTHKINKKNYVGSPSYMSPECIGVDTADQPYASAPSDVWSLGIILVNMCSSHFPWAQAIRSDNSFETYLNVHNFLRRTTPISHECQALLRQILHPDPEQRITLKKLREKIVSIETFFMSADDIALATEHVQVVVADIVRLRDSAPSSSKTASLEAPLVEEESVFEGPSTPFPSTDGSESESLFASESDESMSSSSSSVSVQEAVTPIMLPMEPELEVTDMMAGMDLGESVVFDMNTPKQGEFGGWEKQPTQWENFVNENAEIFELIN